MIRRSSPGNVRRSSAPPKRRPLMSILRRKPGKAKAKVKARGANAHKSGAGREKERTEPRTRVRISGAYVFMLCIVIALACGAFIYHLDVRFEGVRLGYETSKARALQTRLLLERRELRLELASLKSPEQVEEDAKEKLGMEVPDHERIVPISGKRRVVSVSGGAL